MSIKMIKLRTTIITIGVASLLTGCGMAQNASTQTTEETTTADDIVDLPF